MCGLFVDEFENMSCSSVQCSLTLQSWIFDEGSQQVSNMGIGRVGTIIWNHNHIKGCFLSWKVKEAQKFELGVFTKLIRTNCRKLTVNAKDKEGKSCLTCLMGWFIDTARQLSLFIPPYFSVWYIFVLYLSPDWIDPQLWSHSWTLDRQHKTFNTKRIRLEEEDN